MCGSLCLWDALWHLSVDISWQEVLVFDSTGGRLASFWVCSTLFFDDLPIRILHFSCRQRSSSENSPFKRAAAFTITTTSTCWLRRRLNEVGSDASLWDERRVASRKHAALISFPDWDFLPGLLDLILDNKTISGQTINVVQRLSLYPELITSFLYRVTNSQVRLLGLRVTSLWNYFVTALYPSLRLSLPLVPSPGCRGANLLLRGNGHGAAGGLRHSLVCVQLGDERHLGGRGVDGGLVCDQQVKRRRFRSVSLRACRRLSSAFVFLKVARSPSQTGYYQSRPRHSSEGPLGSALLLVPGRRPDGVPE